MSKSRVKRLSPTGLEVTDLAFAPDGRHLATASKDKTIKVWNVSTRRVVATLAGHANDISHLAFSSDGTRLASTSRIDGSVKLWDWALAEEALSVKQRVGVKAARGRPEDNRSALAFSPDGLRLLSLAKGELTVWETTAAPKRTSAPPVPNSEPPNLPAGPQPLEDRAVPLFGLGWAFNFGGIRTGAKGIGIALDDAGNIYVSGMYSGKVDFDPNNTNPNAKPVRTSSGRYANNYVAKYLANGTFQWVTDLGDNGPGAPGVSVAVQGDIVVAGYPTVFVSGRAAAVARLDVATGAVAWLTPIAASDNNRMCVAVGPAGSVYVSGDIATSQVFVSRLDAAGGVTWTTTGSAVSRARGIGLAVDTAGNAYATGEYTGMMALGTKSLTSWAGTADAFVWKLDAKGETTWVGSLGSDGGDSGQGIALDAAGNVLVTGMWGSGSTASQNNFNPNSGPAVRLTHLGSSDCYVAKFAPAADGGLTLTWVKNIGGTADCRGLAITTDTAGNVYTTGSFIGTINFNPNNGAKRNLSSAGGGWSDIFVSKLTPSGDYADAAGFGSEGVDFCRGIVVDRSNNVYAIGCFVGAVNFSPTGTNKLTAVGHQDVVILKLTQGGSKPPQEPPPKP
jgi:Tfp pilus assembly protein PilZ